MTAQRKLQEFPSELKSHKSVKATDFQPANRNKRVIAFMFDSLVAGIIVGVLGKLLATVSPIFGGALAQFAVFSFYWILPTYASGQTLGKKLFNLHVIDNRNRLDLGFFQVLFRETVGRFLSTVPFGLGYLWVSFNENRRTWHDIVAKTRVVHK